MAIQRVLDTEKPDMVIFTGDIVTGRPAKTGWDAITNWSSTENTICRYVRNHDDENGTTALNSKNYHKLSI